MESCNETLDLICRKFEVYQASKGYRFGLESVLLAWFVQKGAETVVDLGCGSGIISLLMVGFDRAVHAIGIEIQSTLAERARRSVAHNGLSDRIDILNADLKQLHEVLPAGAFEQVVSNPPYRPVNSGNINQDVEKALGKHEILCALSDVVASAARLLRPRGRFSVVIPPHRLPEYFHACRQNRLNPSRLRMIHGRKELGAKNCLVESIRSGKGAMHIDPPMIVYDNTGCYSKEVKAILYP